MSNHCHFFYYNISWTDPVTGKQCGCRVAFQVRIRPDSYHIGPQTIGVKHQMDPRFPNSELEWSTKRRGVTVLVGLLVKIEGVEDDADVQLLEQLEAEQPALPQGSLHNRNS